MGTGTGSIDLSTLNNLHDNLTQHFWFNSNAGAAYGTGVHITLSSQAEFIASPTGQNILMNTDGISIRNGTIPLMVLDNDSLDFNVVTDLAQGTYSNVATFGTTGFKIGRTQNGQTRIEATPQGVDLISHNDNRDLILAHFGYRENHDPSSNEKAPFYIFGERSYPDYSSGTTYHRGDVVLWNQNGYSYVCLNNNVTTEPNDDDNWSILGYQQWLYTLCEGYKTVAASSYAHAEGLETVSSGTASHAEGRKTVAGNYQSHAEGYGSRASGSASHAEGCETVADGFQSHAEGLKTVSSGTASHAEGWKTIVSGDYSHVEGKYNVEDTASTYAHIIGNGTSDDDRSNAFAVDWDGNTKVQGNYYANCSPNSEGTAYIGQVFNWQGNLKSNLTANVDAYVEAAGSITLPAGHTYLIIGYLAMTNSTNGTTNRRIQFFNKTNATSLVTESRLVAAQNWGTLQVLQIYETSVDTTLIVRGAANRPTTTIPTAWIRAVCIA